MFFSKLHSVNGVEHIVTALQRPPLTLLCRSSYSPIHAIDAAAHQAHNLKVGGSNPPPATSFIPRKIKHLARLPAGFSFARYVANPYR